MKKINLNSAAFLVLGVFLLLTPALSQAIITSLVTAFFRNIDLLLWVNLAQNFWILNLIPKVVGATLVAGFAWKHLKTRFKVDLPKIKVQTTRLATYSLLFMLCAGLFLFADVPVSEAASTATTGYILDTPISEYDWLVGQYSNGNYYAINGSNWDNLVGGVGSTAWSSYTSNSTALMEQVLAACTSGHILLKDVEFAYDLVIPENVTVTERNNGLDRTFINSANSQGSPYTISVDTVQTGYYMAQDSMGRFIDEFTSTNAKTVIDYVTALTGTITITSGDYGTISIIIPDGVEVTINKGVTGLSYTVDMGASCVINDYENSKTYIFQNGAIVGGNQMVTATIENLRYGFDTAGIDGNASFTRRTAFSRIVGYIKDVGASNLNYLPLVVDKTLHQIYYIDSANQLVYLATYAAGIGDITHIYPDIYGRLVVYSSTLQQWMYFSGITSLATGATIANFTDYSPPMPSGNGVALTLYTGRESPENGYFFWAQYNASTPRPANLSVYRMNYNGEVTAVLTQNTSYIRHFHWLMEDPYNKGTIYVGSGDTDAETHIWKSTDYGDTWTEVAGGLGVYRTLNVAFDENYMYWSTDSYLKSTSNGASSDPYGSYAFVKAPKTDLTDYEILFYYPDNTGAVLSYGVSKTYSPSGVFISSVITGPPAGTSSIVNLAQYWYSFDDGYIRQVMNVTTRINSAYDRGFEWIVQFQNMETGLIYLTFANPYWNDPNYNVPSQSNPADNSATLVGIRLNSLAVT